MRPLFITRPLPGGSLSLTYKLAPNENTHCRANCSLPPLLFLPLPLFLYYIFMYNSWLLFHITIHPVQHHDDINMYRSVLYKAFSYARLITHTQKKTSYHFSIKSYNCQGSDTQLLRHSKFAVGGEVCTYNFQGYHRSYESMFIFIVLVIFSLHWLNLFNRPRFLPDLHHCLEGKKNSPEPTISASLSLQQCNH